jgi:hypothetical protein
MSKADLPNSSDESDAVWQTFAVKLTNSFKMTIPEANDRPRAAAQTRYVLANIALVDLLRAADLQECAEHFYLLAEAMQDLVDGIPHPLFKVERSSGRGGRHADTSAVWRTRSSICIGLAYVIASGEDSENAIKAALGKYRKQFAKVQRPGTELETSLKSWMKAFANHEVENVVALSHYKHGIGSLKAAQLNHTGIQIRQAGQRLIAGAANRAATHL